MKLLFISAITLFISSFHAVAGYKAAVLEYYPLWTDTPTNTILTNINQYRIYATEARDQGSDIIVFPEYGLTGFTDNPEEYAIDLSAANMSKPIEELSTIALENRMYLVVNLLEKAKNQNSTINYYNTNVVFNRKGKIQARYRKINLYNEPKLTPGVELVTFTTDFDVTFGVFICFDILFENPSRAILKGNVTDVVYSTEWFSATPFYTALSVQHGYSKSTGVNLLAANYNNPKVGNGGSGIYLGNGTIAENYIDGINKTKLIIQEVPKLYKRFNQTCSANHRFSKTSTAFTPTNISGFFTHKDNNTSQFQFQNINLSKETSNQLCHRKFCCQFNITPQLPVNKPREIYKIAIFDGKIQFNRNETAYVRTCSLLACQNDTAESCGGRITNLTTKFSKIHITTTLQFSNQSFFAPVSVKTDLTTFTQVNYCEQKTPNSNLTTVKIFTIGEESEVLVFGLWGVGEKSVANKTSYGILSSLLFAAIVIIQAKIIM